MYNISLLNQIKKHNCINTTKSFYSEFMFIFFEFTLFKSLQKMIELDKRKDIFL